MKGTYDLHTDSLPIILSAESVAESDESKLGIILDNDADGSSMSPEILDSS